MEGDFEGFRKCMSKIMRGVVLLIDSDVLHTRTEQEQVVTGKKAQGVN